MRAWPVLLWAHTTSAIVFIIISYSICPIWFIYRRHRPDLFDNFLLQLGGGVFFLTSPLMGAYHNTRTVF